MGNGCSLSKMKKVCFDGDLNILLEKDALQSRTDNMNDNTCKKIKNQNMTTINKRISISSKDIKYKNENNQPGEEQNCSNSLQANLENSKIENNKNNIKFTNFIQDLDISFTNNQKIEQNEVFNINYIQMKTEYNSEIIDYLNKIRNEPNNIISDIDNILNNVKKNKDNKMLIKIEETHENIILDDGGEALVETKNYLKKVAPTNKKLDLNDDLLIDTTEMEKNSDLTLDKKISKILLEKRNSLIYKYPNCQFFINFIKDKKIGMIFLLSQNENKSNFRTVLFDCKYTQFNISWMKEKKKFFISFLCFA